MQHEDCELMENMFLSIFTKDQNSAYKTLLFASELVGIEWSLEVHLFNWLPLFLLDIVSWLLIEMDLCPEYWQESFNY